MDGAPTEGHRRSRRRRSILVAVAAAVGATAVVGALGLFGTADDPVAWLRPVIDAPPASRSQVAAEVAAGHAATLGTDLAAARRAGAILAQEPALSAAVAVLDAVPPAAADRPSPSDPALVDVADYAALRLPARLRAAAMRCLARRRDPAAARLLKEAPNPVDVTDEALPSAWVDLAEALDPKVLPPEVGRTAYVRLGSVAAALRRDGDDAAAARAEAASKRILEVVSKALPPGETAFPRPSPELATPRTAWRWLETLRSRIDGSKERADAMDAFLAKVRDVRETWPTDVPEDRLALARLADALGEPAETALHLEALAKGTGEPARVAATWLVTVRLQAGDPTGALAAVDRVQEAFGGEGIDREGRTMPGPILAAAVAEAAAAAARAAVEGPAPDAVRAAGLLATAEAAAGRLDEDAEELEAVRSAKAYVALAGGTLDLREVAPAIPVDSGPRVVVLADDFELGEPILPSVLRRWSHDLPVHVVGRITGRIRAGIRRNRAPSEAAERESIAKRVPETPETAEGRGPRLEGFVEAGGALESRMGLPSGGAVVLVLDAGGRVAARISGMALDPRPLDPVIERLKPR